MNCVKLCIENHKAIFTRDKIPIKVNDTDVIIKVIFAGICGTDLHIIQGEFNSKDNIVLGHEISGIIVDISQKYVHLKIGDRVAVNPNKSCGICIPCKRNRTTFCVEGGLPNTLGIKGDDGGWAEYCKVHVSQVAKIPDNVSLNQGLLCEPLSAVIHGVDKLYDLDIGSDILIIGAGIIGLLWSCVLHLLGHRRVIVSEPNIDRRNILSQLDLGYKCLTWSEILEYKKENPTYKANICIDCSGNAEAMQAALPLIENGGTFLIFGVAAPEKNLTINPYKLFYNEITILGVNINTPNTFDRAMSYIESMSERYLQIEKLRFATFPLSKHEEALEAFRSGLYTKIIFTPTSDSE